jgi:4a-hydroxytetrahydrobiopterin dehydratase
MKDKLEAMADLLDDEAIAAKLDELDGWSRQGDAIVKSFDHGDFVGSVEFVRRLTGPAEELGHHPDLKVSWSEVEVTITSHSDGGLTANDFELAARIDAVN